MKGVCVAIVIGAYLSCAAGQNECPNDLVSFPVASKCKEYYNCSSEYPVLKTCPGDLYYNCMNQDCEAKPFKACCLFDPINPGSSHSCNNSMVRQMDPAIPSIYYTCTDGRVDIGNCDSDQYFNNITHLCVAATATIPSSTTSYTATQSSTTPSTTTTQFTTTPSTTTPSTITPTTAPPPTTTPSTTTPSTTTPPTTTSSTTTPSTTGCATQSTTTSTPASLTTRTTARSTPPSTSNPGIPTSTCGAEGTKIGNVINSNLYYECQNGAPVAMQCPLWQKYFNCWTNTCSYLPVSYCCNSGIQPVFSYTCSTNGMLIADPASCNSYYKCIDMKVVKQACTNGYVFDVWKKKCLSPMEAKCAISPKATACSAKIIGLLPIGILSVSSSLLCPPLR